MPRDEYRAEYAAFQKKHGKIDPKNPKMLDTHLLPDPDAVKLRVYATTSTHKSLSCFRQGSYIMVMMIAGRARKQPSKKRSLPTLARRLTYS